MTMIGRAMRIACLLALGGASMVASAQAGGGACPAAAPPPPELAGWTRPGPPVAAAADRAGIGGAVVVPGRAAVLRLRPIASVHYLRSPGKVPAAGGHGGLFRIMVPRPGLYRVALGSAAWIDMVRNGTATASIAHGHGPACSGIRKTVDFRLAAGEHVLQVAGDATATATVTAMLVRTGD